MSWTDERVTLLRQLWGEGKTAAEIAKELGEGVTRNAVIGKAHRLKLASRISPIQQNNKKAALKKKVEKAKTKVSIAATRQQIVKAVTEKKRTEPAVKLEKLTENMCRWPLGDPKDVNFGFCGCKSETGLPYCAEHAVLAYQIPTKKKQITPEEFEENGNTVPAASGEDIKVA